MHPECLLVTCRSSATIRQMNVYETDKLLGEYLLFHYGTPEEILEGKPGPREALGFPVRCARECVEFVGRGKGGRALDLGCAVGGATFELAREFGEVIGIDYSHRFVEAASALAAHGALPYSRLDEGELRTDLMARIAPEIDCKRVHFECGDATDLRSGLGSFDAVLMANLIDRLQEPRRTLARLPALVRAGGRLVITSPYTWLEEYTPREHWLGGRDLAGRRTTTFAGLKQVLEPTFDLVQTREMPFLIREHARKYQWSVAQATTWKRRSV